MPRPDKDNAYVKRAHRVWNVSDFTFVLITEYGRDCDLHGVKVFPHDDNESYWLEGTWETESGAAWAILNFLDEPVG